MVQNKASAKHLDRVKDHSIASSTSLTTQIFIVVLGLSTLIVGVYIQLAKNFSQSLKQSDTWTTLSHGSARERESKSYDYGETLVVADNMDAGYLDHIVDALLNFGHKLSFSGSITPEKAKGIDKFDLIWSHDYPFQAIKKLNPLQRINHFPGTGFITNKMTLSTTPGLPNLLKAFRLPYDQEKFLDFASKNPNKMWMQKSSSHRGLRIETIESVNLNLNDTIVQEYLTNPLLIDDKKFDIGIYAVLTSVEPLRVYIFEAEALIRFCAHPYFDKQTKKFNISDEDSYVVGDDYTPIWLMPSLVRHYIGVNLSMKQTLNSYLREVGKSGDKIWQQVENVIKSVYKSKEPYLSRLSRMYQSSNNYNATAGQGSLNQFFEMVRFDFIIDEDLNVYLMEANMSPNLSSRHFPPNRLIYEQVLGSYFSLVGLNQYARELTYDLPIRHLDGRYQVPKRFESVATISGDNQRYGIDQVISEKELSVYEQLCASHECHMNCDKIKCKICYFCLSYDDKLHLRRAIFEHHSRWNFKRLLPSTVDEDLNLQLSHPDYQSSDIIDSNYIHVQWFRGKCDSDSRFCSY